MKTIIDILSWDTKQQQRHFRNVSLALAIAMIMATILFLVVSTAGAEEIGYASWYSVESCRREGTSGIMANGEELKNEDYTCAIWDYPFGTKLKITNLENGLSIQVEVTDRGPAKRLYKKGRIIDLTPVAFKQLAPLERGIIQVKIEYLIK